MTHQSIAQQAAIIADKPLFPTQTVPQQMESLVSGMQATSISNAQHSHIVQCPPEFLTLTTNTVPQNSKMAIQSALPLGLIVHPLLPTVHVGSSSTL